MKRRTVKYKKEILAENVPYCISPFSKMRGLMFARRLKKGEGLLLVTKKESIANTSIHMFFVFFSIDILWLNTQKKVIDKREHLLPFTCFVHSKEPAMYVLELPLGTIKNIPLGAVLDF